VGLILDTSLLIAAERRSIAPKEFFLEISAPRGPEILALSAISVVELTHGIYRAKSETDRQRRRTFASELFDFITIHAVSPEIAELAGRIEGEQAARGVSITF
jgi:predicted nucleic acid-binding protein